MRTLSPGLSAKPRFTCNLGENFSIFRFWVNSLYVFFLETQQLKKVDYLPLPSYPFKSSIHKAMGWTKISSLRIHDFTTALKFPIFIFHVFVRFSTSRNWQNAIQLKNPLFRKLLFSESRIRFEKPEGNCLRLLEVTRVKMSRFNIWLANAFSSNLKTINLKILLHFVDLTWWLRYSLKKKEVTK